MNYVRSAKLEFAMVSMAEEQLGEEVSRLGTSCEFLLNLVKFALQFQANEDLHRS